MRRSALISSDGSYRYWLHRSWGSESPDKTLMIIGLNPSTADAHVDDATIRKSVKFAKTWGMESLLMLNLFAFRSTDPKKLYHVEDPIGLDNDKYLKGFQHSSAMVLAAWGAHGSFKDRDKEVLDLIYDPFCLGVTKDGQPRHPLYIKDDTKPVRYRDLVDRFGKPL